MLYKVSWGIGKFGECESYQEHFRSIHAVRESFAEEGALTPGQIAELTVTGRLQSGHCWVRIEQVNEPPFHAEAEQRVREVTLLWSAGFFLVMFLLGAVAIVGAFYQVHWAVRP